MVLFLLRKDSYYIITITITLVFHNNLRLQTLHEQLMVSFRCDTDSSNREGFATAYASAIFAYVPTPSAADDDVIDSKTSADNDD